MSINFYEKELFLQSPSDQFECPICYCIMKDPVSCPEGHTFCRHCLSKHLDVQAMTCPTCRVLLSKDKLVPSRLIRSLIEDSEVRCLSEEYSCDWTGKLKDAELHYVHCPFSIKSCPHSSCDEICIQRDLSVHIKSCLYRLVLCDWCDKSGTIDEMYSHSLVCSKGPVPCPNGCFDLNGKILNVCRDDIAHHRSVCFMEEVSCAFAITGCNVKRFRRDMHFHESDFTCMRVRYKKKRLPPLRSPSSTHTLFK
jgi:hypothetical protein